MKVFYILKPDAITRPKVLKKYEIIINNQTYIKNRKQYLIDSWIDLSCLLYESNDENLTHLDIIKLRKKMLTTIKGYDYLFKDIPAIIDIFDIPNNQELLKLLETIKYQIRDEFVLNTPKNYLKFLNLTNDILSKELKEIPVRDLNVSHIKVNYNENILLEDYQLAHLNCIHFPDPNIYSIDKDLEIIESSKVLTKKIKL